MATKADRGTKRTCQNADCGERFYDLGRDKIVCPVCSSPFMIAAPAAAVLVPDPKVVRPAPKPDFETADQLKPDDVPDGEEALVDIEAAEDTTVGADDETFLEEEEEEPGDVKNIVGGPGEGEEDV